MSFDWATVASVTGVLLAGLTILNRRIDRRFDAVDRKFEAIDRKFDGRLESTEQKFDGRFESMEGKFDGRFESVEGKFDRRFEVVEQQIRALAQDVANLRQDVGRLQGVVERTYQPDRFTRTPAQVRERRPTYGVESPEASPPGGDEPEQ
jgi:hypothetical protein